MGNLDKKLKASERHRQALELRRAGLEYSEIARRLGYKSGSGAFHAVDRALRRVLQEPAEQVLQLELQRLDKLMFDVWPFRSNPAILDRILHIMDRRAKYLGLDAPVKKDITSGGEPIKGYVIVSPDDWDTDGH